MKHSPLLSLSLLFTVTLSACTSASYSSISQENLNPLVASRYGDELADTMANFIIQNDPIAKDEALRKIIDAQIIAGKQIADDARKEQSDGLKGGLLAVQVPTNGYALYLNDALYFSSDFETKPGAELHVYLTTEVDPRGVAFPDKTAIDLGILQKAYGAQQYDVPPQDNPTLYRTLVLWDKKLSITYAFAQLSK